MKTNKIQNTKVEGLPGQSSTPQIPTPAPTAPQTEDHPIRIDFNARYRNRSLPTAQALDLIAKTNADLYRRAEVVGTWIWIAFPDKQPRTTTALLAQLGFHWNNTRQLWQHPCGGTTADKATEDPRAKYGTTRPAESAAA